MRTVTRTPFETARLQRVGDLLAGNRAMTMDYAEAAALERWISALEKGLPPLARDRVQTGPVIATMSPRSIGVSGLGKFTGRIVEYLGGVRSL